MPLAVALGDDSDWERVWHLLISVYPGFRQAKTGGAAANQLLDGLDENKSGSISVDELAGLTRCPPIWSSRQHFGTQDRQDLVAKTCCRYGHVEGALVEGSSRRGDRASPFDRAGHAAGSVGR